jgi:BCCT family betaine/carnitine transporter
MNRIPGRVIDLLFIVGLISSAATGLGFGTSVAASALTRLINIEDGFETQLAIISIMTLVIAVSVYRGLDSGIKNLSNLNSVLALSLVAFVFLAGPTRFILEMGVASVGHLASHFVSMLTWTDPLGEGKFVESWTVFYWAWWLALGPFVGMFVCKISEGRTLRELIVGMLVWGSAGCALFFLILGNYALHTELHGIHQVVSETTTASPSAALASLIERLPAGLFWLGFLAVIGIIFTATTYDSASYTLAAGASRKLAPGEHPARWHRVFWAAALGILPASLLYLGGLKALQTASVVASLPLLVVYGLLYASIIKTLKHWKPSNHEGKVLVASAQGAE